MKHMDNSGYIMSPYGMGCWITRTGFPSNYKPGGWGDAGSDKCMRDIRTASDLGISVGEVSDINPVNIEKAVMNDVHFRRSSSCCKIPQCTPACE